MELKQWAETGELQRRGSAGLRSLLGLSKTTDFGVELRCCKVFVEGKKGNVVAKVLREELSNNKKVSYVHFREARFNGYIEDSLLGRI